VPRSVAEVSPGERLAHWKNRREQRPFSGKRIPTFAQNVDPFELNGKRIVLIGGTSGFGFATAKAAASEGAAIVVASSSKTKVDQAVAQLPDGTEGRVLDINCETSVEAFFSKIGEFDHLAITAGESLNLGEFATIDLQEGRRFFETRFWGSLTVAKHASRQIKSTGSIILTNGVIGLRPHSPG
jgi:NAD(P)-dependent dehydrogenase (short-subunit alcohol dehydrogenase family)